MAQAEDPGIEKAEPPDPQGPIVTLPIHPPKDEARSISRTEVAAWKARDITDDFTAAASALRTGTLVKDEFLSLFEAVGALEIMDPKMDSGYLEPGDTLDDDYDACKSLEPKELLGIMDQLLCNEVAWHMGHPLSRTLFTSVYIDRLLWPEPKTIDQAQFYREKGPQSASPLVHVVLRAFCLGLIKACDYVHKRVCAEHYYEEEDFATQTYHRQLLSQVHPSEIQLLLDNAISWCEASTDVGSSMKKALEARLILRQELLSACELDVEAIIDRANTDFASCIPILADLERTYGLGTPVESSFSVKIQRRLASSVPPRPMVKVAFNTAVQHLRKLCYDASDIRQVLDCSNAEELGNAVSAFMSRRPQLSVYIRALLQSFLLYDTRILGTKSMRDFLYDDLAALTLPYSPLLEHENHEVELPSDPRYQIAQHMDDFVKRVGPPYINLFRSACLNRSRVRRNLCHAVLDWDSLQADAEDVDTNIRKLTLEVPTRYPTGGDPSFAYPLSSWTYHYKLQQIRQLLQLGFELSIYAPDEIPGIYWYLSHICQTHLAHLDRIAYFTDRADHAQKTMSVSTRSDGADYAINHEAAVSKSMIVLGRITAHLQATEAFAGALHALFVLLFRLRLIAKPVRPYSSDEMRYELRMKPLLQLALPEIVPYEDFKRESAADDESNEELLERAMNTISRARRLWEQVLSGKWQMDPLSKPPKDLGVDTDIALSGSTTIEGEWTKGIKDTLRACIGTSIALTALRKNTTANGKEGGHTSGEGMGLGVEIPQTGQKGCWHDWWVVPKITAR